MFETPSRILLYPDKIQQRINNSDVHPATIDLELSWLCNHSCEWCAYEQWHKMSYLSIEKIQEVVNYCKNNGVKWVVLSGGGEPTLNPHFKEIIELLESEDINYALFTNGSMLEKYKDVFGLHCKYLRVSLDAGTSQTYSRVHGVNENEFFRILNSINDIKKRLKHCYYGLSYVITENNCNEILEFVDMADKLNFNEVLIRKDLRYPEKSYPVNTEIFRKYPNLNINWRDSENHINRSPICYGVKLKLVVDPDGNVPVCLRNREIVIGNINENRIEEFWNTSNHNDKINSINTFECQPCRFTECNNIIHNQVYKNQVIDII